MDSQSDDQEDDEIPQDDGCPQDDDTGSQATKSDDSGSEEGDSSSESGSEGGEHEYTVRAFNLLSTTVRLAQPIDKY